MGYLLVALLAAAVAVFTLQNSAPTTVRFLVWTVESLPVAAVALMSLASGLILIALPLWINGWRWRSRARSAEGRIATLERTLAEREQALLRRPQPEPPAARPPAPPPTI
jgi:uncharacterized integral membrane protein